MVLILLKILGKFSRNFQTEIITPKSTSNITPSLQASSELSLLLQKTILINVRMAEVYDEIWWRGLFYTEVTFHRSKPNNFPLIISKISYCELGQQTFLVLLINIIGDELLLNFGTKFQR